MRLTSTDHFQDGENNRLINRPPVKRRTMSDGKWLAKAMEFGIDSEFGQACIAYISVKGRLALAVGELKPDGRW